MTTRTQRSLAENVLRALGLLDALDSPSAEDSSYVVARYNDILAEMSEDNLAYWPADVIPLVVFEPLTLLVALSVSPAYGKPMTIENLEQARMAVKRRIRRHTQLRSAQMPVLIDDF